MRSGARRRPEALPVMAHPSKFVSVNLNKSYGQPSSYATAGHGRPRSGGGGMVVLSRSRSSPSAGQKTRLAVPPPLNLPSLRKEHERFEPSSSGTSAGRGISGLRSGSGPSTMGWSKPALPPSFQDNEVGAVDRAQSGRSVMTGDQRPGSPYMPPGARPAGQLVPASPAQGFSEKAVILRGEDFPSLRATAMSVPKQKEASNQKQRQRQRQLGEEHPEERAERFESQIPLEMRPQIRSSRASTSTVSDGDRGSTRQSGAPEQSRKQNGYMPGPLPLVRLQHTSDWADDERDTGLSIPERDRDRRNSRFESRPVPDLYDGRGLRDTEAGGASSREFFRGDSFGRDVMASNKEGRDVGSWRTPLQPRDRLGAQELGIDRDRADVRPFGGSREMGRETNNVQLPFGDSARDGGTQDSLYTRKDLGFGISAQNGRSVAEAFSGKGAEQNTRARQHDFPSNWNRGNSFPNNLIHKSPFPSGSKGLSLNDPILNFGREKRLGANSGRPYIDDAGFDIRDPFSGGIGDVNVKVFKRKKDAPSQADFHDPVRESFEAELERILRMQEQERQRVMEEQARALELARKEEEERERMAREEEERRRLLEEEAREARWRAEQEKLEGVKRAEEQRIAREEEKKRILMEEERRKDAARQKLFELEARIAKRQTVANAKDDRLPSAAADEQVPGPVKERDAPIVADVGDWEEGERMVERITSSASSDSSNMNRYFNPGSRPYSSRNGNPSFTDRGKHAYHCSSGNGSSLPFHDQENIYRSTRRDSFGSRRGFPKTELHSGGGGIMSARPFSKGGNVEHSQMQDDFRHASGQRWSSSRDGDNFNRNSDVDADFLDNDKFGDVGWGPGNSHGSPHAPYAERVFQNSEVEGLSSFTRFRHSLRQPRVPPPPSMTSMHRSAYRPPAEHPSSSSFMDSETRYHHARRNEQLIRQTGYDRAYHENLRESGTTVLVEGDVIHSDHNEENNSPRCDSQSSLSVSSPPGSPMHPSHDEMDVSGDSPALPPSADGERTVSSDNEHNPSALEAGNLNTMTTSSSASHGEDDEWAIENNEEMQQQEEYDEEDNNYQEIDEVPEGDDENLDLGQEFKHLQSDVQSKDGEMDQVILGFNEGVEVQIPSNDEFEMTARNSEKATARVNSPGPMEEMVCNGVDSLRTDDAPLEETANNSSIIINETEKALQDLLLDPVVSTSYPIGSVEASSNTGMPAQNPIAPTLSLPMPSSIFPPVLPSASTVATQGEVPVKLPFGLFSGPSLIPSPVPAIQIGSIQMPIHLHTQVGPSLTQVHPSHSPMFQFGQLRYTPPISQSVLPQGPQTMPFVQPPVPASYSLNQNPSGCLLKQAPQDSSQSNLGDGIPSTGKEPGLPRKILDPCPGTLNSEQPNALSDSPKKRVLASLNQTDRSCNGGKKSTGQSASQIDHHSNQDGTSKKNCRLIANRESQNQLTSESQSSRFPSGGKAATVSQAPGMVSGVRGRRFAYVKNAGSKLSYSGAEPSITDSGGFQRRGRRNNRRTEFRVRENFDRKQTEGTEPFYHGRQDKRPHLKGRASGISVRNAGKKDVMSFRSTRMMTEQDNLNSGASSSQVVSSESKTDTATGKEASSKSIASADKPYGGKWTLKANGRSEEDVDAPLQSGVVRVFKQPGIEAPSDEDDFIEVRSKRQILNDRREQREKEIKSKSRVQKVPRKQCAVPQSSSATSNLNKAATSLGGDAANSVLSDPIVTEGRGFTSVEPSLVFPASTTSQTLPPIGTPSVNVDSETRSNNLKSNQTVPVPVITSGGAKLVPGLVFDSMNVAPDNASMPLASWDSANLNQQVMALTQTQLDEAMKPAQFDSHVTSGMVPEPHKPMASIMAQEKPFCSSPSPINSLLAGEKIQFGAVTSPSILPPFSRTISNGLGPPGSCRLDVKIDRNLLAANNDCNMFFDKEKHPDEPCPNLEDPEAEAEAAASAVAVAAITNDEVVGSDMHPTSASDAKSFSSADVTGLAAGGVTTSREVTGQSAGEESLTVALPADLSVDTPSLSLWPPLPSPQSSGPMLSHFPGAPPSHFPCFEMNPMLGGRIFAFGPHDESGGTQGQSQRSTTLGSGPIGAWPQCPSGVDSFYGPPAGFTGPFISPGGIPGVQGPHMVVYNHFSPVGQFGQVGLSFMGTTYIPTGKQPDWKHNPASSTVGDTEGNLDNLNVVSGQCTSHSMPTPIQHLGPGSPLMPMASPLTMFDIMPFQSSDVPMQARWSHVPAPPLHSVPLSMPLQQHHIEGGMPPQHSRSLPVDASTGNNQFHEPRSSEPDDGSRNIPVQRSTTSEFSGELGLLEQPASSMSNAQTVRPSYCPASGNNDKVSNTNKTSARTTVTSGSESSCVGETSNNTASRTSGSSSKPQQPTSSGQHYLHPIVYADQRSGASKKMGSGGEWHRRTGYQGRNQGSGADKNFSSAKMKQIYVAKPSSGSGNPRVNDV
ncbi:uncharacterized protein LOC103718296 isoform X2 [Phoenix dactylifera]|uniref:Uncharacterized protein LOC103718296 isoform X2 n=1 Tax=Phoenix dactylifera TaxID=42345 RepID=A0A8B7CS31_PHODC|nr:uncharacterized protein LOC103718296 isoform X2 [Phoenix dactylifera]